MPRKRPAKKTKLVENKKLRAKKVLALRPELLLGPNVPKPMHGVAPRVVLGAKWWNAERKAAYNRAGYRCQACGVMKWEAKSRKWLEAHEQYKIDYDKGLMHYVKAVALCHYCHNYIHDGRLNSLLLKGKVTHAKFAAIMQHGDAVLAAAGLHRKSYKEREADYVKLLLAGEVVPWHKWRLVIGRKKFPPKFKSAAQWYEAMK